jgi:hypothetical protein
MDIALRQFHSRHRGMRKAVISANGALTLQVARSLRLGSRSLCRSARRDPDDPVATITLAYK